MHQNAIMLRLIKLLSPRTRAQYVTKPALTMLAYLATFVVVDFVAHGGTTIASSVEIIVIAVVQAPFMLIAFSLVIYLNKTQTQIARLALTDALTGLSNRRKFSSDINDAIRQNAHGYMLIVDADHFKKINDTFGHAVGDVCLQAISARLEELCTAEDYVGRIGGEECGMFLMERTEREIETLGQHLVRPFSVITEESDQPLCFTLSAGGAELRETDTLNVLMRRADQALYEAKQTGRGKLVIWRKSLENRETQMPLKAS